MIDFNQFVNSHLIRKITVGKSGADVYELNNGCIAKHISRNTLDHDDLWNSYLNEYMFYDKFHSKEYFFVPEIYHLYQSGQEIQIVMKKYTPLKRYDMDDKMLSNILSVLASIHCLPLSNEFMCRDEDIFSLNDTEISDCLTGWHDIIAEHGDLFSKFDLLKIAEHINEVNQKLFSERKWCCHGDFHFENILTDHQGNMIVCDWQGVHRSHIAGDIAFFISRLLADGYQINEEQVVQMYCDVADIDIKKSDIMIQMKLSNLNTSFAFWHHYLHGCSQERVYRIFEKMITDMKDLLEI